MEEYRRLGLCYNCNENFECGHNKVCRCHFVLEGMDDNEVDDPAGGDGTVEDTEPHMHLHAIAGVHTSETMQIHLQLNNNTLLLLLDFDLTHNFILEAASNSMTTLLL